MPQIFSLERPCLYVACRHLWSQVHELPPPDYQDASLLDTDPDLVLLEGPDGLGFEVMRPFLAKWEKLADLWANEWKEQLQVGWGGA